MCRYLLSFIAKDDTDEARFFAYDDEASKIIQKDCQALVKPLHIKEGLPQAMNNILNKTYVLSVDLTDESCKSIKKRQYQVKAVLDRPPKRPSLQIMATSPYHPPHTTSSTPIIKSPEHSADLLLIEAATQSVSRFYSLFGNNIPAYLAVVHSTNFSCDRLQHLVANQTMKPPNMMSTGT